MLAKTDLTTSHNANLVLIASGMAVSVCICLQPWQSEQCHYLQKFALLELCLV